MLRAVAFLCLLLAFSCASAKAAAVYRVRPGDTLSAIALRYRTTVARLEHLNRLSPTAPLLVGARLTLPLPALREFRYRIVAGDTLTAIALRFKTTPAAIAAASGIQLSQPILSGAILHVPGLLQHTPPRPHLHYRVRPGDSLSAIALHFGVSLGALADLNHLALSAPLLIGARLTLPAGTIDQAPLALSQSTVRGSILHWADHYGVSPHLATALAWMESGFNNELVSTAGAVGVMQITPETWSYVQQVLLLGQSVPHNADGNVRIGVAYLHHLLHIYNGDPQRALAAYYQGARALQLDGLLPGTLQYVDDILALEQRF